MQVHYDEGVANHIGPEPCVGVRERVGEASAGENVGQALSRESRLIPGADALRAAEGNTRGRASASVRPARRGRRPWHAKKLLDRELGDLTADRVRCRSIGRGPHREGEEPKPMMHGDEKSDAVVVAMKPTNKTGKPAAELVEPRTAPERNANEQSTLRTQSRASRVTGARPRTARSTPALRRHLLEGGAGCGKSARPDLCGGRPAMAVPTANGLCRRKRLTALEITAEGPLYRLPVRCYLVIPLRRRS